MLALQAFSDCNQFIWYPFMWRWKLGRSRGKRTLAYPGGWGGREQARHPLGAGPFRPGGGIQAPEIRLQQDPGGKAFPPPDALPEPVPRFYDLRAPGGRGHLRGGPQGIPGRGGDHAHRGGQCHPGIRPGIPRGEGPGEPAQAERAHRQRDAWGAGDRDRLHGYGSRGYHPPGDRGSYPGRRQAITLLQPEGGRGLLDRGVRGSGQGYRVPGRSRDTAGGPPEHGLHRHPYRPWAGYRIGGGHGQGYPVRTHRGDDR